MGAVDAVDTLESIDMTDRIFLPNVERLFDYFHHRWERKDTFALIIRLALSFNYFESHKATVEPKRLP